MRLVYERHLGADWLARSGDPALWEAIDDIDDGELWEAHQTLKARLIAEARRRLMLQAERRGRAFGCRRATAARAQSATR